MKIKKNVKKGIMPYIMLIVLAIFILGALEFIGQKVNVLTYDQFEDKLATNKVKELSITQRDRA